MLCDQPAAQILMPRRNAGKCVKIIYLPAVDDVKWVNVRYMAASSSTHSIHSELRSGQPAL